MTISISNPPDGPFNIANPFSASGQNDTGDDVAGWLLDTKTNNAFVSDQETLTLHGGGPLWDWTLQFKIDQAINVGDNVILYVYDAETGGDGDSVSLTQTGSLRGGRRAPAPTSAPVTAITQIIPQPPLTTGVLDITVTASLQPEGVAQGSVFLVMKNNRGARAVLQHHLPPSSQRERPVTFRKIDVGAWDTIHAIVTVKRHKGAPTVSRLKPR